MPFAGLLSARYWIRSHVQVHHPAPNVIGFDDDCDLRPLFCINDADIESASPRTRWLFRFQLVWLALLLPLNGLGMQRQGLAYWWSERGSDKRSRRGREWVADGLAMLLHVVVRFVIPLLLHVSAWRVFGVWALWLAIPGVGMFAILGPGHYPHAARVLAPSERRAASFWLRQTATTVNFRTGTLGALLCAGLEYQIEHHLFPGYCHVHYAKMAPLVRAFCDRHGLPYTELGWGEALIECLRTFATPKPVVTDVRTLVGSSRGVREPPRTVEDRRSA
jgi:fatty acid desaturase